MTATFQNLGIQCVKKKDIEAALKVREEIRVDPFRSKILSQARCRQRKIYDFQLDLVIEINQQRST